MTTDTTSKAIEAQKFAELQAAILKIATEHSCDHVSSALRLLDEYGILRAQQAAGAKTRTRESTAVATLEGLGYTWEGGELWKPPLGKSPFAVAAGEPCEGANCGTTTGQHSEECFAETAVSQGWAAGDGAELPALSDEQIDAIARALPHADVLGVTCWNIEHVRAVARAALASVQVPAHIKNRLTDLLAENRELHRRAEEVEASPDPWQLLQNIDTWACMLPTFEVIHEGGPEAASENIIIAIKKATVLLGDATPPALAPKAADAPKEKTRSERMREAGYTRRPTWKSLPSDEDDDERVAVLSILKAAKSYRHADAQSLDFAHRELEQAIRAALSAKPQAKE